MSQCPECMGSGAFSYPCKKCNGMGESSNCSSPVVKCHSCGGSGRFYPKYRQKYGEVLKGLKFPFVVYTLESGEEILAYRCRVCQGRGKIIDRTAERLSRAVG